MKTLKIGIVLSLFFIISACFLSAGSYPDAELYELNYPEDKVKSAIRKLKSDYPELNVPTVTIDNQGSHNLLDKEVGNPTPHWFKFYFYNKEENEILYTWTRDSNKDKTTFAFVSVNKGLNIPNWKDINKDFSRKENKEQLKKFERLILEKVKYYLENAN